MAEPQKNSPSMRGWMRGLLVISLGLNVVVAGLVIGMVLRYGPGGHDSRPPRQDEVVGSFTAALSKQERRELGRKIRQEQRSNAPSRAQFRADNAAFIALLRQPSFDRDAAAEIFARQRSFGAERAELGHRVLLDHLDALSATERAAYADRLEQQKSGREGREPPPRKP